MESESAWSIESLKDCREGRDMSERAGDKGLVEELGKESSEDIGNGEKVDAATSKEDKFSMADIRSSEKWFLYTSTTTVRHIYMKVSNQ